jgi:hypothetical protein
LRLDTRRMLHCLGVARKMKEIANTLYPDNEEFAEDMFMLGLLHDVGYEYASCLGQHAEIAGKVLERNGYKYWKEVFYHGKPDVPYDSEPLRILNIADLHVNPDGRQTNVQERLADVKERYGETSSAYIDCCKLAGRLGLL